MAITQIAPFNGTVVSGISEDLEVQINVTGNTGPMAFTIGIGSPNFFVGLDGVIGALGLLLAGTYEIAGTVVDSNGNAGVWAYSLSVIGSITPQTSVTPISIVGATGVEMLVPFQIDPATGAVAQVSSYLQIYEQHIVAIIMTAVNERVMMPTYGCGVGNLVFTGIQDITRSTIASDISKVIGAWEPAVDVQQVLLTSSNASPSTLAITVVFSVIPLSDVDQITVSVGGQLQQLTSG